MDNSLEAFDEQPRRPAILSSAFLPLDSSVECNFDDYRIVKPGLLCSKCKPIASWVELNWDRPQEKPIRAFEFQHYPTGLELEDQYMRGCHLCALVWHSIIEDHARYKESSLEERLQVRLGLSKQVRIGKHFWIFIHNPYPDSPAFARHPIFWMRAKFHLPQGISYGAYMHVEEWLAFSPNANTQATRANQLDNPDELPVSSTIISTASRFALQLASSWLEECVTTHKNCQIAGMTSLKLPRRLLKIEGMGGKERLRVVLTDGQLSGIKYAALSYCWGGYQGFKLTLSTQEDTRHGVRVQRLPRTIRDAIKVTRNLGLKFLWVDSLCIIQDSLDGVDWTREAASMVDVYRNCYVYIGATGARTANEGLFANRDPLIYKPCRLTQRPEFEGPQMFVHPHGHPFTHFENCFTDSSLHQRAWVMQERILAPRTLNFGTLVVWECREHYRDEFSLTSNTSCRPLKEEFFSLVLQHSWPRELVEPDYSRIRYLWNKIVTAYTQAHLTVESDKLIALSGIITAIERSTGWRNIAGLWEPFLIYDLIWYIENPSWKLNFPEKHARVIRSPSWSWVSLDQGIMPIAMESLPQQNLSLLANIEKIDCHQFANAAGAGGRSGIRISCIPMETLCGRVFTHETFQLAALADYTDSNFMRDDPSLENEDPDFYIPLGHGSQESSSTIYGLLVIASNVYPGAYERLGLGITTSPKPLSVSPIFSEPNRRQIVTLV